MIVLPFLKNIFWDMTIYPDYFIFWQDKNKNYGNLLNIKTTKLTILPPIIILT
jgi:hypothetical protein